jgi:predicted lipid-binding transport protein (Tim44 family)
MAIGDIVVFAAIAAFILLRYRSMLGDKTGRDPADIVRGAERIITLPRTLDPSQATAIPTVTFEGYSGAVQSGMRKMNAIDPNFTADSFLEGAKSAFEMIIEACRDQDHDTLKMLLSPALYDTFARELDAQVVRGEKSENTLIAIRKTEITEATLNGTKAEITVAFTSDQIQLVKNSEGDIIEGDSSQEVETDDIWCFARDLKSNDPNWSIIRA